MSSRVNPAENPPLSLTEEMLFDYLESQKRESTHLSFFLSIKKTLTGKVCSLEKE
jgi:hypothetical protein